MECLICGNMASVSCDSCGAPTCGDCYELRGGPQFVCGKCSSVQVEADEPIIVEAK